MTIISGVARSVELVWMGSGWALVVSSCFALQVLYTSIDKILRGSIIRFDAVHAEMVHDSNFSERRKY